MSTLSLACHVKVTTNMTYMSASCRRPLKVDLYNVTFVSLLWERAAIIGSKTDIVAIA